MRRAVFECLILIAVVLVLLLGRWLLLRPYQLHWAAYEGDVERMQQVLDRGADPDLLVSRGPSGYRGSAPIIYAIEGQQPEAIRVLAAAGADLNSPAIQSRAPHYPPPLAWALHRPELTRAMLESGADPNVRYGDNASWPILTNAPDCESVLLLIEFGANVAAADPQGYNGISTALWRCHDRLPDLVAVMLAHGVDPDTAGRNGKTLLMIAAYREGPDLVRLLLDAGADPTLADEKGKRAIDHARDREDEHREAVIQLLLHASN